MDVRSYLGSTRFAVVVSAIALAIPTGYLVSRALVNEPLGFLTMFVLGVSVPRAYSRSWPEHDERLHGIAWAVGACLAALLVLLVAYVAASTVLDDFAASIGAFLVVELAISAVSRSLEPESDGDAGTDGEAAADADGETTADADGETTADADGETTADAESS